MTESRSELAAGCGVSLALDTVRSTLATGDAGLAYGQLMALYREHPHEPALTEAMISLQHLLLRQLSAEAQFSAGGVASYLGSAVSLNLIRLYLAILQQKSRTSTFNVIRLGSGGSLWNNNELFPSLGMNTIAESLRPANMYTAGDAAFDALPWAEADVVVVLADNAQAEIDIVQRLRGDTTARNAGLPVYCTFTMEQGVIQALSMMREHRSCLNVLKLSSVALAVALSREGPIFECGAYRCGTSAFMAALTKAWGQSRHIHALDTYSGMPAPTAADGSTTYTAGTMNDTSIDDCARYLTALGLRDRVTLHQGYIQDVLPRLESELNAARLLFSDTDQYAGTMTCFEHFVPRMQPGSIFLSDDLPLTGVTHAVRDAHARWRDLDGFEICTHFYAAWRSLTSADLCTMPLVRKQ